MSYYYFLEYCFVSSEKGTTQDLAKLAVFGLTKGIHDTGTGKILHVFKVTGESRLLAVVQVSSPEQLDACICSGSVGRMGDHMQLTCTPVSSAENFAEEKGFPVKKRSNPILVENPLYWFTLDWEREGLRLQGSDLQNFMDGRDSNKVDFVKVIGQNKMHLFMHGKNIDLVINGIVQNSGSPKCQCKAILHYDNFTKALRATPKNSPRR